MKYQKRLISLTMFDFVRGVGIILVVLRHSIHMEGVNDSFFFRSIYTVTMPIFFMISGYWMKKRTFREGFKSNVKSFLIPYVVVIGLMDIVGLIHRLLISNIREWFEIFLIPSLFVYSDQNTRIYAMWFVFCLFIGWTIIYAIFYLNNEMLEFIVSLLICVVGTFILPLRLPFQIGQAMIAQFFLYTGYLIKQKKFLEKYLPVPVLLVLLGIWLIGGYISTIEKKCDFALYVWGNGMPAVICSICGAFFALYCSIRLNQFDNCIIDKVGLVGRYTPIIIYVHSFECAVFPWKYLFHFIPKETVQGTLAQFVLRSAFIYFGCFLIKSINKYTKDKRRIQHAK